MAGVRSFVLLCALGSALGAAFPVSASSVVAATPHRAGGWLVVDVQATDLLDPRTRSTVESGLPGNCVLQVELREDGGPVTTTRWVERSLEFDLWQEVARVRDGAVVRSFASIAAADSAWSRFDALPLIPWSKLDATRRYRLQVRVFVQPLGARERERVSRWVSERGRSDGRDLSLDLSGLVGAYLGSGSAREAPPPWQGPGFRPSDLPTGEVPR